MSLTSHRCCARLKISQASLDIFSQPHHHPFGSCIHRKAINKDNPPVL